ncbi:MAG: hypothetical protein Q9173_007032, partial [Seirophora scorigena]
MSSLILGSYLGTTNLTRSPTVTSTDKAMRNFGIIIAVISVIIDVISICWLTLKTIAYLRHRRSRRAPYGTDGRGHWKTFNGGFNLKPLWSTEDGAYDKLPTTDKDNKYYDVQFPTDKKYKNQHGTPTKAIFHGDDDDDYEDVDDDDSDDSTPHYPAADEKAATDRNDFRNNSPDDIVADASKDIFKAVASGNDHNASTPAFDP